MQHVHLSQVGRVGTQSLPNIALPGSRVPEIQVSAEETKEETISSRKSSTESREFWEETTQLLYELSILREDVSEINCPCHKPGCPFKHERNATKHNAATRRSGSTLSGVEERMKGLMARKNVARYLSSMQQQQPQQLTTPPPTNHPLRGTARAFMPRDTLVTEEPLAVFDQEYFIRSAPARRAQRRHSMAMRVSNSFPTTMNSLAVPLCLDLRYERLCGSLPNGMDTQLGSSLDSLDSEKMQDIQKSHQRRQMLHMSNMELDRW